MIGALKETAQLLLALRGVATEARDALMSGERPLRALVCAKESRPLRLAACQAVWALAASSRQQQAPRRRCGRPLLLSAPQEWRQRRAVRRVQATLSRRATRGNLASAWLSLAPLRSVPAP